MFLTDTWLTTHNTVVTWECTCTPPGYGFLIIPRGNVNQGAGIGVLFKKSLDLFITPSCFETLNFEHVCVKNKSKTILFVAVYRPLPSPANGLKTSDFLIEFELFLDELSLSPCQLVILVDFNIHVDIPEKWDVRQFLTITETIGFC